MKPEARLDLGMLYITPTHLAIHGRFNEKRKRNYSERKNIGLISNEKLKSLEALGSMGIMMVARGMFVNLN